MRSVLHVTAIVLLFLSLVCFFFIPWIEVSPYIQASGTNNRPVGSWLVRHAEKMWRLLFRADAFSPHVLQSGIDAALGNCRIEDTHGLPDDEQETVSQIVERLSWTPWLLAYAFFVVSAFVVSSASFGNRLAASAQALCCCLALGSAAVPAICGLPIEHALVDAELAVSQTGSEQTDPPRTQEYFRQVMKDYRQVRYTRWFWIGQAAVVFSFLIATGSASGICRGDTIDCARSR